MKKPQMKREIGIEFVGENIVVVKASPDSLSAIGEFGTLEEWTGDRYCLKVDPRFDFQEVVEYLRHYGKDST